MKITYHSKGLGDTVEKLTTVTGIKFVADSFAKMNGDSPRCTPCEERRKKLNEMFPYKEKK